MSSLPATAPRPAGVPRAYSDRGSAAIAVSPDLAPVRRRVPEARPHHLRVVAPEERLRRGLTPLMAGLLAAFVFATLLAVAVAHTLLVKGQVDLDRLDSQLSSEQARYQELRREVAELESPTRVVAAAHQRGMVTPDDLVYLQPGAPDPATNGKTPVEEPEASADPGLVADLERPWDLMKPLLEASAP